MMKHYGDITKINGAAVEAVDIITGGSPCQDLSVAGKRAGLAGERSGLFMDQIRIIKEMRNNGNSGRRTNDNIRPRFMVWENVQGAFTSNDGDDFRAVLEETARVVDAGATIPRPEGGRWAKAGCILGDGYSIAWRLHDAQFWGVPQRRCRIALVADFAGHSAHKILFESESVPGDTEPGGKPREEIAENLESGATESGGGAVLFDAYQHYGYRENDTAGTVTTGVGHVRGDTPIVYRKQDFAGAYGEGFGTLRAREGDYGGGSESLVVENNIAAVDCWNSKENPEINGALQARAKQNVNSNNVCRVGNIVRRLTPLECERLQGFPDDWTNIGDWIDSKGKTHSGESDGPRYKALGNSIALPFWRWMARRMVAVLIADGIERPTMASLFDGIGGFPLVYSECGAVPVWASEIEEFGIAVTRRHFPSKEEQSNECKRSN